jgi:hypothetical protein
LIFTETYTQTIVRETNMQTDHQRHRQAHGLLPERQTTDRR